MCVVTGASSGIGRALSLALAREGARVWALGRSEERLSSLAAEADGLAGDVVPVACDLERDSGLETASREIASEATAVDVLVHAAGTIALGPLESISIVDIDRMLHVNLRAPVLFTRTLLPALRPARGQVVFVNSNAAHRPSADNALYAATKRGLAAVADGLREELNDDGVRVISVFVGRTATPMQAFVHQHEGKLYRPELLLQSDDVAGTVLDALAFPRGGELTEVNMRPATKSS